METSEVYLHPRLKEHFLVEKIILKENTLLVLAHLSPEVFDSLLLVLSSETFTHTFELSGAGEVFNGEYLPCKMERCSSSSTLVTLHMDAKVKFNLQEVLIYPDPNITPPPYFFWKLVRQPGDTLRHLHNCRDSITSAPAAALETSQSRYAGGALGSPSEDGQASGSPWYNTGKQENQLEDCNSQGCNTEAWIFGGRKNCENNTGGDHIDASFQQPSTAAPYACFTADRRLADTGTFALYSRGGGRLQRNLELFQWTGFAAAVGESETCHDG